jgi:iron complex transport system permease protein
VLTGLADVLGRSLLAPLDIPLGLMTAVLGAPYLLILLSRQRRGRP